MKHFRSFRLWAIVIFLLCISTLASFACKTGRSSEEQSVYETVLKHHLSEFHSNQPKFLVIRENTAKNIQSVDDYWEYLHEQFPFISPQTLEDCKTKNKVPKKLKRFESSIDYVFLGEKDLEEIFKAGTDGWQNFYKRYPGSSGFIALSQIGFNKTMDQALVFITDVCGMECGVGRYILLQRNSEGWQVIKAHMVFVA
jgi:hypothetical protein